MGKKKAFYTYTADGKLYYRKQVIAALYSEAGEPLCGDTAEANSYGRALAQALNDAQREEKCASCHNCGPNGCNYCNSGGL